MQTRDAHFPSGNRETGNQVPGNFPREMGYREIGKNREKIAHFKAKNDPKTPKSEPKYNTIFPTLNWQELTYQNRYFYLGFG